MVTVTLSTVEIRVGRDECHIVLSHSIYKTTSGNTRSILKTQRNVKFDLCSQSALRM